jgi:hypothetical protein
MKKSTRACVGWAAGGVVTVCVCTVIQRERARERTCERERKRGRDACAGTKGDRDTIFVSAETQRPKKGRRMRTCEREARCKE